MVMNKTIVAAVGLLIALVFALGFDVILLQKEHHVSNVVQSIQNANAIKAEAVYQTCLKTRPANTEFIGALINAFRRSENIAGHALRATAPKSSQYDTRRAAVANYSYIVRVLKKFLPVKCVLAT
jgi:hypothetical protein